MTPRWLALASLLLTLAPGLASAQRTVNVSDAGQLTAAFADAMPGDSIVLAAGTYEMGRAITTPRGGTAAMPIVVRAGARDAVTVRFFNNGAEDVEGFRVTEPYWRFVGLRIEGTCDDDHRCEHAFHVQGAADFVEIRGNVLVDFNAQIKANGADLGSGRVFPDDVLIEGNEFFNHSVRQTSRPVTPIDVVGGRRWLVRLNYIHDFAKGQGNGVSYAAFLKGNSRSGIFERNLVVCEQLHTGGIRLGLSFGGGGTSPASVCEDGTCTPEHQGGLMRNNIIAHCPNDVGIYVNACTTCVIANNTVYDTGPSSIDLRFAATSAEVHGNLTSGAIRDRVESNGDMPTSTRSDNLGDAGNAMLRAWFTDPDNLDFTLVDGASFVDMASPLGDVPDDFCGNDRTDAMSDIGAVEYDGDGPCDTTTPGGSGPGPGTDAGPPDLDAGVNVDAGPGTDAGAATDAGPDSDAGMEADAGPISGSDAASPGIDAGSDPGPSDGGCGCRAYGPAPSSTPLALSLLFGITLVRRRRGGRG